MLLVNFTPLVQPSLDVGHRLLAQGSAAWFTRWKGNKRSLKEYSPVLRTAKAKIQELEWQGVAFVSQMAKVRNPGYDG